MTEKEIIAWLDKLPYIKYDGLYMYSQKIKLKNRENIRILKKIKDCVVDEENMTFYLKHLHINT